MFGITAAGLFAGAAGSMVLGSMMGGDSGGGGAPATDPRLVEAQIKSMGLQDDAMTQIMKNSAEMAPLQKEQLQFGLSSAKTAYAQSQDDRGFMLDRRKNLSGVQDTILADAATFNTDAKREELAGQAMADVNQGFSSAREQSGRAMARMGVNPSSGAALAMNNQTSVAQAGALASASNQARTGARLEGRALTDRASNALAGYPAMSMTATGQGAGFGASGISIANTGLAGLNSGALEAGRIAGQMGSNAAGMYGIQQTAATAAQGQAGEKQGAMLGAAATIGAAALKFSDRRLKCDIVAAGAHEASGLMLYDFAYKTDPSRRYRGVMADEVVHARPDAVTMGEDGFARVNYAALGIDMVEITSLQGE